MDETAMHHGRHWGGQNVRGWFASEKFRGCRVYWDGATMWTRGGNRVRLPQAWLDELPAGHALDGEIWAGRGPANGAEEVEAVRAALHGEFTSRLHLMVFDAPDAIGSWDVRMREAAARIDGARLLQAVPFRTLRGLRDLEAMFAEVHRVGGEGLMLRSPRGPRAYVAGRTKDLLKVKLDPALARGVVRFAA